MKRKLSLFVALLFATMTIVNAQNSSKQINAKYQGEVNVGYGVGVGTLSLDRVYVQTIQGVKIGEYFSTGLGLGVNIIPQAYGCTEAYMPLFLNLKGYLPVAQQTSLFASFDIGGSFGLSSGLKGVSGFMFTPAVGVSIKNKVNLSLGYDLQKLATGISGFSLNMGAVALKLGYRF